MMLRLLKRSFLLLLAAGLAITAIDAAGAADARGVKDEVIVPLQSGGEVGLSTRGPSAFRVRLVVASDGVVRGPIESPMVSPDEGDAAFKESPDADGMGITASFGSVKVTRDDKLMLFDAAGKTLTESAALSTGITSMKLTSAEGNLYGRGASPDDAFSLTSRSVEPQVCNRATYAPYYYSTDGYGALGVVDKTNAQKIPLKYSSDGKQVTWDFTGAGAFELYFMPAASLAKGTEAYYSLIGAPRVPPKYAFGFMASRWGWQSKGYIEETMDKFRQDKFPIDGFIVDFEWFTNESDYTYQPHGTSYYKDFGFNSATFPAPKHQLARYAKKDFRMGGIRKPRLGNTHLLNMARSKGWILPGGEPAGSWPPDLAGAYAKDRCLDFSNKEVRNWYSKHLAHFVEDGVDFWWNDEGETDFFTFHFWNVAQIDALRSKSKKRRFYSLNRAWTPGMARLGATVWTGDINPTWEDLGATPGMMLNWVLAGAPYVACDIGGFTGDTNSALLTRWMQVGTFMPTMRVHSTFTAKPHWPWLWGKAAASAMRAALELRYRLVPYHYSLAHALFRQRKAWIRPLAMEFPDDVDSSHIATEWMDGDILVAPVMREDSRKQIYLPPGVWYPLAASDACRQAGRQSIQGPQHIDAEAKFEELPAFVRAGTVLPLAPVVQSTEELPGGPLEVQIYAGADGYFDFVEDDGETTSYEAGHTRTIHFRWQDSARRLTWQLEGYVLAPTKHAFTHVKATVIDNSGDHQSETWPIGIVGSIDLERTIHMI
mmetsp:Transcript_136081/g.339375  ORF Transcript_136081/g.339375 Transcript_136081/m.339375 type:complete len:769 (-) Transcript_136081:88-2394(-)|eukprot:CAMPEP_0115396358 /NCGR_PEP_ID=MMETSP0271-20121206/13252_1 /TAXON_ID=71861 /ORGANISM="Scrippsiella trochoidea, Strain CCMP3099" /LENGTH=768 /DNA_ID=CAMNT_0002820081 /DNA_START=76 /DNA_END=2382 /DNA_ORIENTATION=-